MAFRGLVLDAEWPATIQSQREEMRCNSRNTKPINFFFVRLGSQWLGYLHIVCLPRHFQWQFYLMKKVIKVWILMNFAHRLVWGRYSIPALNVPNMDCFRCWLQKCQTMATLRQRQIYTLKRVVCEPTGQRLCYEWIIQPWLLVKCISPSLLSFL